MNHNRSLLTEWKPAYRRGYTMQASLAIVAEFFGLIAYFSHGMAALVPARTEVLGSQSNALDRMGRSRGSASCRSRVGRQSQSHRDRARTGSGRARRPSRCLVLAGDLTLAEPRQRLADRQCAPRR